MNDSCYFAKKKLLWCRKYIFEVLDDLWSLSAKITLFLFFLKSEIFLAVCHLLIWFRPTGITCDPRLFYINLNHSILLCITLYTSISLYIVHYLSILLDIFRYYKYYSKLPNITLYYSKLPNITLYYSKLPNITLYYSKVLTLTYSLLLNSTK